MSQRREVDKKKEKKGGTLVHSRRFTTLVSFLHLVSSLQSSTLCSPTVCDPLRLLHSKVPLRFTNLRSSPILYSLYPLFRIASSPDAMGRRKKKYWPCNLLSRRDSLGVGSSSSPSPLLHQISTLC